MTPSLLALLGYTTWMLLLVGIILFIRVPLTLTGKRAANQFSPAGDDVSPFSGRVARAHANCYENLPVFAGLIVVAHLAGHHDITDRLALAVVGARVVQSLIHLASTSPAAVTLRFVAFSAQWLVQASWAFELARVGLA